MPLFPMVYTRSVTIEPFISEDVYGARTYGEAVTVPAILSYLAKDIKDFRGNTFITDAWIAVPPDTVVNERSRITLPDGTAPFIGSISRVYDEEAQDYLYTEIYIGKVMPGEGSL